MSMPIDRAKRAFTLLELLIVIAGIGALMAVVLVMNSGATESARAAKCKSHMRNLAQAVQSYAISSGHYPNAGSFVYLDTGSTAGKAGMYRLAKGWIGLNEKSKGVSSSTTKFTINSSWNESCMNNTHDPRSGAYYAVTNGSLWRLVHNVESYVCPAHSRACRKNGVEPLWSYAMNAYFGYDSTCGQGVANTWGGAIEYGKMSQTADRTLLFAEIPIVDGGAGRTYVTKQGSGHQQTDCTLQFHTDTSKEDKSTGGKKCHTWKMKGSEYEMIGFNHKVGKIRVAHVAFADAHIEELVIPNNANDILDLTADLCNGRPLVFEKGVYRDSTD